MPKRGASSAAASKTAQKEPCCICCQPISLGKDEALFCAGKCQQWLHRYCASVTVQHYKTINDNSVDFLCPSCCRDRYRDEINDLTNTVAAMKLEIAQLKETISRVSESVTSPQAAAPSLAKPRSYAAAIQDNPPSRSEGRRRRGRPAQRKEQTRSNPSPAGTSGSGQSESQQATHPTEKVIVKGARRLWGTHQETSSTAVRKAIGRLCHDYSSVQLKIRRKTKTLPNNRHVWWFVLHDDEESLKKLENSWGHIQLQTDWKIEPCYMPATPTENMPTLLQLNSQTVAGTVTNSSLEPSSVLVDHETGCATDHESTQVTQETVDNGTSDLPAEQPSQQP